MEGGDETPGEDNGCYVDVGGDYLPEDGHPFEGDVGDVEGCYYPFVAIGV